MLPKKPSIGKHKHIYFQLEDNEKNSHNDNNIFKVLIQYNMQNAARVKNLLEKNIQTIIMGCYK